MPIKPSTPAAMLLALTVLLPGCFEPVADIGEIRDGWRMEQAGEYHRAYELYCKAAEKNPGSQLLATAIDRTAPSAGNHYEDRAHRAVDKGDYAEAWRLFMRVLDIRPDHPSAPHLIRRLERDHPQAIAVAKSAYLILGPSALSSPGGAKFGVAHTEPVRTTEVAVAEGNGVHNTSPVVVVPQPTASVDTTTGRRVRSEQAFEETTNEGSDGGLVYPTRRERTAGVEGPGPSAQANLPTADQDLARIERMLDTAAARTSPARRPESPTADRPEPAPAPKRLEKRPSQAASIHTPITTSRPTAKVADEEPVASAFRESDSEVGREPFSSGHRSPFQFMVVRTLSKKDSHFPKKAEILDGLMLELRDTDDDPSADLTVFLGSRQIAKLKEIKIGEPHVIVGRSGRVYEVIVLSINDNRQTARVGVRAASDPGSR